ncbi:MAG: ExeM/NucH family extracellular endonuclease [Pseudomonadota bacterium]
MALNPGDIGFTEYNADGIDRFAFVALVEIPAGEVILFTDNGWLSDDTGFRANEGVITWTAPTSGVTAGTVVAITTDPSATVGTVAEAGSLNFSASGDQIIAYQEVGSTITPIAALNNDGAGVFQSDATSSNTSALPVGLMIGESAVAVNEIDNIAYSGPTTGERALLQAALFNSANWTTGSNTANQTGPNSFALETSPEAPQIVITEILYNAASSESTTDTQFIEIHNAGNASIDLSGWTIDDEDSDGPNTLPFGTVIAAGATLVLVDLDVSDIAFTGSFSTATADQVIQIDGNFFNLSNSPSASSEIIQLADASGTVIDEVNFDDASPWPGDPGGFSIYYTGPLDSTATAANDDGAYWALSAEGIDGAIASTTGLPFDAVEIASPGVVSAEPPAPTLAIDDVTVAEGDAGTTDLVFSVTLSADAPGPFTVDFATTDGEAAAGEDYVSLSGTLNFAGTAAETQAITVSVLGDTDAEDDETLSVILSNVSDASVSAADDTGLGTIEDDDAAITLTKIHEIQGTADQNLRDGEIVTVEAVVVGDFQENDADDGRNLRGFFLQEETGDADDADATSEGIFVFDGSTPDVDVNVGDIVRVTGTVDEFFGETQIDTVTRVELIQAATPETDVETLVTRAVIDLPSPATTLSDDGDVQPDLEAFEGMLVRFADTLTITELFQLDRFNEIKLTEGDRPQQFSQFNDPDAAGLSAYRQEIGSRTITYDDGLSLQNQPIDTLDGFQGFSDANAPSMGDTIDALTGVLSYQWAGNAASGATWRVRATEDGENTFADTNPRETAPDDVRSDYKVASLNVLNFFTTLDEFPSMGEGSGPNGLSPRGADANPQNARQGTEPLDEYTRQLDKLVTTLIDVDADVIGLVELENDFAEGGDAPTGMGTVVGTGVAIEELVSALNTALGDEIYDWVRPAGQTTTSSEFVGGDAIAVGFIYDTTSTALIGEAAVLDTEAFIDPNETTNGGRNRAALAQTFEEIETGGQFTASVNHFKSKGDSGLDANEDGIPDDPSNPDSDQVDGQGYWNDTRTKAAAELIAWLGTDPTGAGDEDLMILGDLNAYAKEDPIQTILAGPDGVLGTDDDYADLTQIFEDPGAYSFVFDGLTGTLDYALVNEPLLAQITGTSKWNINSDEADALDYNLEFSRDPALFDGTTPFRSSDHDPIIVGLDLDSSNAAPIAENDVFTIDYHEIAALDVLDNDNDPDGDALTLTEIDGIDGPAPVTLLSGAVVSRNGDGTLRYDPNGAFAYLAGGETAVDTFDYTTSDGDLAATASVSVTLEGDPNTYNSGDFFVFFDFTNGGANLFGFNGNDLFIAGQGVSGFAKFDDFDDFLVKAAEVYDGDIEKAGVINDQRLDDGDGPNNISVTANDAVTIGGSGIAGSYRIQFDDKGDAQNFEAFVEKVLGKIDDNNVVATDPDDFRFDITDVDGPDLRVFYDKANDDFGLTDDGGLTQVRFGDLETFVETIVADLGGVQVRDGSFNDQRIADGATPFVRVNGQDDLIISGQGVGGRFKFEFENGAQADLAEDGLETLFALIDTANAVATDPLFMV